jgi:uncharacterized damage-inducible protein DinB
VEAFLTYYASINESILRLVDRVPADKVDWSPRSDMWGFRQLFVHISNARHYWLDLVGEERAPVVTPTLTLAEIAVMIRESFDRLADFARDEASVGATYEIGSRGAIPGAHIVYSRLTHDVHHRAEILAYLAELGTPAERIEGFEHYGPQPDPLGPSTT